VGTALLALAAIIYAIFWYTILWWSGVGVPDEFLVAPRRSCPNSAWPRDVGWILVLFRDNSP
jgi:hypothetical protein